MSYRPTAAPITAGTYTAVASFVGSTDYAAAQSKPVTFTIKPAVSGSTMGPNPSASAIHGAALLSLLG